MLPKDPFYYFGFFNRDTKRLISTQRMDANQAVSAAMGKLVDKATDKNLYVKEITKEIYANFSPADVYYDEDFNTGGPTTNKMNYTEADIQKGAKHELEHAATVQKIKDNPSLTVADAARLIAIDHLNEDPKYYEQAHFNEGGNNQMAAGGTTKAEPELTQAEKSILRSAIAQEMNAKRAMANHYLKTGPDRWHQDNNLSVKSTIDGLNKKADDLRELYNSIATTKTLSQINDDDWETIKNELETFASSHAGRSYFSKVNGQSDYYWHLLIYDKMEAAEGNINRAKLSPDAAIKKVKKVVPNLKEIDGLNAQVGEHIVVFYDNTDTIYYVATINMVTGHIDSVSKLDNINNTEQTIYGETFAKGGDLTAMKQGKIDAVLDKTWSFPEGTDTYRARINRGVYVDKEFDGKEYSLIEMINSKKVYQPVSKTVYDYFDKTKHVQETIEAPVPPITQHDVDTFYKIAHYAKVSPQDWAEWGNPSTWTNDQIWDLIGDEAGHYWPDHIPSKKYFPAAHEQWITNLKEAVGKEFNEKTEKLAKGAQTNKDYDKEWVTGIMLHGTSTKCPDGMMCGFDADAGEMFAYKGKMVWENELPATVQKTKFNSTEKFAKGGNLSAIEKKAEEVNRLIALAKDSDGDPLEVIDTTSTWQAPMRYKPFKYSNGVLYEEHEEMGHNGWETKKNKVLKANMEFDNPLNDVAKMYRKALKEKGIVFEEGGGLKEKVTTKYYKLEYKSLTDFKAFLVKVKPFVQELKVFFAGVGDAYLIIKGEYDDSPYSSDKDDFHSIISQHFGFHYQTLASRPAPEKRWDGKWLTIDEAEKRLENFEQGGTTHSSPASEAMAPAPEPKFKIGQILTDNDVKHALWSNAHDGKRTFYIVIDAGKPEDNDFTYRALSFLGDSSSSIGAPVNTTGESTVYQNNLVPYYPNKEELSALIDKFITLKEGTNKVGTKHTMYTGIVHVLQELRAKIENGHSIYKEPNITTFVISSAAPLFSQTQALVGHRNFTTPINPWQPFFDEETADAYASITVKDAKAKGVTGIQIPSEGAVHNFFMMIEDDGEHAAVSYYKDKDLLTNDVISSLLSGYATGKTYQQEYELLKNIAVKFFNITHMHPYKNHMATGGDVSEGKVVRLDENTILETKGDTKVITIKSGMYKGIYTVNEHNEVSDDSGIVKDKVAEYILNKITPMQPKEQETNKAIITSWDAVPHNWKLVKKVPKVPYTNSPYDKGLQEILEPFTGTDTLRPVMAGFYFDDNGITATDAHRIIVLPYPNKQFDGIYCTAPYCQKVIADGNKLPNAGKTDIKNDKIEGKYPSYAQVWPTIQGFVYKISVYKLKTFCKAILLGKYTNETTKQITFVFNHEDGAYDHIAFNGQFLVDVCDAFLKLGHEFVYMSLSMHKRATVFSASKPAAEKPAEHIGKEIMVLLMPVALNGGDGLVSPNMQGAAEDVDWGRHFELAYNLMDDEIYNHDGTKANLDYNLTIATDKFMTDAQEKILRAYLPKTHSIPVVEDVLVANNSITATNLSSTVVLYNTKDAPNGMYRYIAGALDKDTQDADNFPKAHNLNEDYKYLGEINRAELLWHLQKAIICVGNDDLRPAMSGIHFIKNKETNNQLFVEATNAHVGYRHEVRNTDLKSCDFIVSEPAKLVTMLKNMDDTLVQVYISGKYVAFVCALATVFHYIEDSKFPNLAGAMPLTTKKLLSIDIKNLKKCIKSITKEEKNLTLALTPKGKTAPTTIDIDLYDTSSKHHTNQNKDAKHIRHLCQVSGNYEAKTYTTTRSGFVGMSRPADGVKDVYFALHKDVLEAFINATESDALNLYFNEVNQAIMLSDKDVEYAAEVINAPAPKKAKATKVKPIQEPAPTQKKDESDSVVRALKVLLELSKTEHEKQLINKQITKLQSI